MKLKLVKRAVPVLLALGCWSGALTARAEQASVHFHNGGCVAGELLEYVPGDHVSVRVGEGAPLRFPAADVQAVQVSPSAASCAPQAPAANAAPAVRELDLRVRSLLVRRAELQTHQVGIGFPMTLTIAGGITAILGLGVGLPTSLADCSSYGSYGCREDAVISGVAGSVGLVVAVAGSFWVRSRLAQRRARSEELHAIEYELGQSGALVGLAPWFTRGARDVTGLRATLSF